MAYMSGQRLQFLEEWQANRAVRLNHLDDPAPTAALPRIVALEQVQSMNQPKISKLESGMSEIRNRVEILEDKGSHFQALGGRLKKLEDLDAGVRLESLETSNAEIRSNLNTTIPALNQIRQDIPNTDGKVTTLERTVENLSDKFNSILPRPNH